MLAFAFGFVAGVGVCAAVVVWVAFQPAARWWR